MFRTMSVTEFKDICADPSTWYRRYLRPIKRSVDVKKTAGNIVHLILSDAPDKTALITALYRRVESVLGAAAETEALVSRLMEGARRYSTPEQHTSEEQTFYTDPETGWSLCATTDLSWVDSGGWLHIAEHKSGRAPMFNQLLQLQFYALVVSLAKGHTGPIKCHLRLLGAGDELEYVVLRERLNAFHNLVKRALKHFDMLIRSSVDYATKIRPKVRPYMEAAMEVADLPANLHAWWEVSRKSGTHWTNIHATKVRSWKELRMCPVRVAQNLAFINKQRDWAPQAVPVAKGDRIDRGEFVAALRVMR
ncbi:MAG: PD-(D/E)XK nuclease family protein [Candidatus Obscuribacterales bacterium]|nr:PD-(D/E)XK nuclease family protein [Candidatus Obscuribacterales bacterium]